MDPQNQHAMIRRTYTIPMYCRELEVRFADGVLGIDMDGVKRGVRLLPTSVHHGPVEPGQTSINWETGEPEGGDGLRSRQYKTERDRLNEDFAGTVIGVLDTVVGGAIRWLETPT